VIDADYRRHGIGLLVVSRLRTPLTIPAGMSVAFLTPEIVGPPPGAPGSLASVLAGVVHLGSPHAACSDLATTTRSPLTLAPGESADVPVLLTLRIAHRSFVSVRSRSGLAKRTGLGLATPCPVTTAGLRAETITLDTVRMTNRGNVAAVIDPDERIVQVASIPLDLPPRGPLELLVLRDIRDFPSDGVTDRGGGYGSSGRFGPGPSTP